MLLTLSATWTNLGQPWQAALVSLGQQHWFAAFATLISSVRHRSAVAIMCEQLPAVDTQPMPTSAHSAFVVAALRFANLGSVLTS